MSLGPPRLNNRNGRTGAYLNRRDVANAYLRGNLRAKLKEKQPPCVAIKQKAENGKLLEKVGEKLRKIE